MASAATSMPNRRKPTIASTPPNSSPTAIDAGGMANWVRNLRRVNVSMQGEQAGYTRLGCARQRVPARALATQKEGRARLAPGPARSFPRRGYRRGLDRFLEVLGDAEGDLLRRLDLDRLAGRRVAAHARRTVAHLKNAEARDADLVALLEMLHDQADEIVEAAGRVLLGHARLFGQFGRHLRQRDGRSRRFGCGSHDEGSLRFFVRQRLPDAPGQR